MGGCEGARVCNNVYGCEGEDAREEEDGDSLE